MRPIRTLLRALPETTFADLLESEAAFLVVLDVPGATADGVEVTARNRRLEITADTETSVPAAYEYRSGERAPSIEATIPLPPEADVDAATASIDHGVLEIEVPKTENTGRETATEQ